jgi:hypothetical protein
MTAHFPGLVQTLKYFWGSKPPFSMNDIKKYSGPINLRNSTVKFDLFSLLLQGTR